MGAMGVRQIAGAVNLVRLNFFEKVHSDLHILFAHRVLFDGTGFIKWEVKEVCILFFDSYVTTGGSRLTCPDQSFDRAYFGGINLIRLFLLKEFLCVV